MKLSFRIIIGCILGILLTHQVYAQNDILGRMRGRSMGTTTDSLEKRTGLEDSITLRFRYLDTTTLLQKDSSVLEFFGKIPLQWHDVHLGNMGTATRSLLFKPMMKSGWHHGFHALDNYNFTVEETKFYNTTRPFSELVYMLGGRAEQLINILHTQNVSRYWNIAGEYRLMNSPGYFQSQDVNHNNYRLSSWYQSKNRRYQNFAVIIGNKLQSSENGGIRTDSNYLTNPAFDERLNIPTRIGMTSSGFRNFFSSQMITGTRNTTGIFMFRQQYDIVQKDSLVTDTVVVPLFYPRLRLEHTISYRTYNFRFRDNESDSAYYFDYYNLHPDTNGVVYLHDKWRELVNDFSFYTFPDAKNPAQFLKLGAALQNLTGLFDTGSVRETFHNVILHGEYRNRTKNKKWDIEAGGNFHVVGETFGDYLAYVSLKRLVSEKLGSLQVGFENVNRSPSAVFQPYSSFFLHQQRDFNKENTAHFYGKLDIPQAGLHLEADYYILNNYTYFRNYYIPDQAAALFNMLRISGKKVFPMGKKGFNWKAWLVIQQKAGSAPVNFPQVITRHTIGYDGKLGFPNLMLSVGLEGRYILPYISDNYSPVMGRFFYQDSETIKMKLPEITAYLHLRIRSFAAYLRVENLNTFDFERGGFLNNNIMTPGYPYPGMHIRLGVFWGFVN